MKTQRRAERTELSVEAHAIERDLRRRFRVVDTPVAIGARTISLLHPASAEELISEVDFERDERLPYWAEFWPSSRVLAATMLERTRAKGTERVLELGCGVGLVATCAVLAGYAVTATDYYEDALAFTRVNVARNGGRGLTTRHVDWRDFPGDELRDFDLVIAADVLYERPYGELVAAAVDAAIAFDGAAIIADPGRVGRARFVERAAELGLAIGTQDADFGEGSISQRITLLTLRR